MRIETSDRFDSELEEILDFIALDSPNRAIKFYDELMTKIYDITEHPFMYRKRMLSHDRNIREMIFRGYTVPFLVDEKADQIYIFGIFNQNLWV